MFDVSRMTWRMFTSKRNASHRRRQAKFTLRANQSKHVMLYALDWKEAWRC